MPNVYLFWDNSNIFHSAQNYCQTTREAAQSKGLRISFEALHRLAVAGRTMKRGIAVGSLPPDLQELWSRLSKDTGVKVELYDRGALTGKEQGVDQCLQTHMLRAALDEEEPQVAVLLTGDGKGYLDGVGFHADLERMYKRGWAIEVISWDLACKKELKEWATSVGAYVRLEDYYDQVTFVEGFRKIETMSLTRRAKAQIGQSQEYKEQTSKAEFATAKEKENLHLVQENQILQSQVATLEKEKDKDKKRMKYYKRYASKMKK